MSIFSNTGGAGDIFRPTVATTPRTPATSIRRFRVSEAGTVGASSRSGIVAAEQDMANTNNPKDRVLISNVQTEAPPTDDKRLKLDYTQEPVRVQPRRPQILKPSLGVNMPGMISNPVPWEIASKSNWTIGEMERRGKTTTKFNLPAYKKTDDFYRIKESDKQKFTLVPDGVDTDVAYAQQKTTALTAGEVSPAGKGMTYTMMAVVGVVIVAIGGYVYFKKFK